MATFTRGFGGRRRDVDPRVPPGQTTVADWPVLSASGTPIIEPEEWQFSVRTETGAVHEWSWDEVRALGIEDIRTDIHCVTHWSKLDMGWRGVPLDAVFADVETSFDHLMVHSYGGYTTNLPLAEVLDGKAWIAFEAEGEPLSPEHGGPARLLVPHLYFWKSAKWVRGITMQANDEPGFWENAGYHLHGDPWKEERYW
ncbi:molybdopterin-dependent oxidoreductase [Curtobacterium sp. MCBD17_019]|uniref:molybdopterin-dependent oxidoreductase n=1 Tax=Curtobacterium sp. MCBD17_019 TaxID=2175669 RepID=UPI000DA70714|nr:molybdopterin-dependent oxidoreductase [Curtobacterium sp. MCBD17_019]PZE77637.1 sulfite oxidase-like oxidoreductase [Curtobacterium sp. MCBD17_019]